MLYFKYINLVWGCIVGFLLISSLVHCTVTIQNKITVSYNYFKYLHHINLMKTFNIPNY